MCIYNKYIKKQREKKDVGPQDSYLQPAQKLHQGSCSYQYETLNFRMPPFPGRRPRVSLTRKFPF